MKGNEKKYVIDCIDSSWISSKGNYIDKFEKRFANFIGSPYATSVCNGTVALHLAMVGLDLKPGDEVIIPTLSYVASANSVTYVGATPIFVDSCESHWQMNPSDVRRKITPRTRAIMAVHLYGHPCDMDELVAICNERDLFLIEDCAEAIGTFYQGKHVGTFGDIATFSFYGNKTITTGEGGMIVCSDKNLFDRCYHHKTQGLVQNKQYWHDVIGYNYRMTNICAAIGLAQIEEILFILQKKREIAGHYREKLKGIPVTFHDETGNVCHSYWMCSILVPESRQRDSLRYHLEVKSVETRPFFSPLHQMPMYNKMSVSHPVAESIGSRGINLPSYPALTYENVEEICGYIRSFFDQG